MKMLNKFTYALFALIIASMILASGCNTPATDAATEDTASTKKKMSNSKIFDNLKDTIEMNEVATISVVRIDDMVEHDAMRERQVYQELLEELTKVELLKLVEVDSKDIEAFFKQNDIDPGRGLNSTSSIALAKFLNVDAIIYCTIETYEVDINVKMYSAIDGGLLYVQTLRGLQLPTKKKEVEEKFEIPEGLLEDIPE